MRLNNLKLGGLFILLLTIVLSSSCEFETEEAPKDLDLSNLSIKGDFGFKDSYNYNYESEADLQKIIKEIWSEGNEALENENSILKYDLVINPVSQTLTLSNISNEKLDSKDSEITTSSTSYPVFDFSSCPDGWDHVATCFSEDCVSSNLAEVFADVDAPGTCMRAQVSRTRFSASVCSQPC